MWAVIKVANSIAIGTTSNIVVKIANKIGGVVSGKAKDTCVASKGL